jgi:signal transduction histidine kinase
VGAPQRRGHWWQVLGGRVRTRLLVTCLLLLLLSAVASTLALRALLAVRLEDRIGDQLDQELRELDRVAREVDPATGRPFASVSSIFELHLSRAVPDNEEAMLAFVDGQPWGSNLAHFPLDSLDELPPDVIARWQTYSQAAAGRDRIEGSYDTPLGEAHFQAARTALGGQSGAFVVTILPAGELREIGELQRYGVVAIFAVLLLASLAAWLVVGRVLKPVRQLTSTARSISRSNLTQRVEESGSDEAAEMAHSFNSMLERLESAWREQRQFVQDTSHELRDPITICRGHLQVLGPDPEERRATLELVLDELDRMSRTVDDLELLADAEQPDFVQPEPIDVRSFTNELAAKASALAPRNWLVDPAADGSLVADRHRLTEAVMNLARNAVHNTLPSQTIAIGSSVNGTEARLWVRDTGRGILLSDQMRIFDRFTRGRGAHRLYRGSGLGLAIVKSIAEAHGGRVDVESDLGAGATFTLALPLQPDAARVAWRGS